MYGMSSLAVRAYPRVCGATKATDTNMLRFGGLSPRVRGNLMETRCFVFQIGPIPACAGQPHDPRP